MRALVSSLVFAMALCGVAAQTVAQDGEDLSWDGVPLREWIGRLKSPDADQRRLAVAILGHLQPIAKSALPAMLPLLEDENLNVRLDVAETLWRHERNKGVPPALVKLISDEKVYGPLRGEAAIQLWEINRDPRAINVAAQVLAKTDAFFGNSAIVKLLVEAGDPGVAALVRVFREGNDKVRDAIEFGIDEGKAQAQAAAAREFAKLLADKDAKLREDAADVLRELSPEAPETIPALLGALKDEIEDVRVAAARALGAGEPDVFPKLLALLQDKDETLRVGAAVALDWRCGTLHGTLNKKDIFGKNDEHLAAVAKGLARALADDDASVRRNSVSTLRRLGPQAKAAVPELIGVLKQQKAPDRIEEAAEVLGKIGPAAKETVPVLIEVVKTSRRRAATKEESFRERLSREKLIEALGLIGPEAQAAVPLLTEIAAEDGGSKAAESLGRIGPAAKAAKPTLLEVLKKKYDESLAEDLHWAAALALWRIDKDPVGVPALIGLLEDDRSLMDGRVMEALGEIGPPAAAAVPVLVAGLNDPFRRADAAKALTSIAARGKTTGAVRELAKALKNPEQRGRQQLLTILASAGSAARPAVPALIELVRERGPERPEAVECLGSLGIDAKEAVSALLKVLDEGPDNDIRVRAAAALWRIDKHPAALPALGKLLRDEKYSVQSRAADGLIAIGAPAIPLAVAALDDDGPYASHCLARLLPASLPDVLAALRDKKPIIRAHAAAALATAKKVPPEAAPALIEALKDRELSVRAFAAMALKELDPEAAKRAGVDDATRIPKPRLAPPPPPPAPPPPPPPP